MKKLLIALAMGMLTISPASISATEQETEMESEMDFEAMYYDLLKKYEDLLKKYEKLSGINSKDESSPALPEFELQYGRLIDASANSDSISLTVKIKSMGDATLTVRQNYLNIFDLVQNQGFDEYSEIQYEGRIDIAGVLSTKAISFTVPADTIEMITDKMVTPRSLDIYLEDLWIIPDLMD